MKGSFTERIQAALRRGWRSWCENSDTYLKAKYGVKNWDDTYSGPIPPQHDSDNEQQNRT